MFSHYTRAPTRELVADLLVYGFLRGRYLRVTRQHAVGALRPGAKKRQQIDFRYGTHNPRVIEFAFCARKGATQLYGSQNRDELAKLTRCNAALRCLLLIDLRSKGPLLEEALRATYAKIGAGSGKFKRRTVRIIYAHVDGHSYDFQWRPSKPSA
jgi:hypothetical protein